LQFENVNIKNFKGTTSGVNNGSVSILARVILMLISKSYCMLLQVVSLMCSPAAPCKNFTFTDFNVTVPSQFTANYTCQNAQNVKGIPCTD
jgi:hypothetical protein